MSTEDNAEDKRAVRAWIGNSVFFAVIAAAVIFLAMVVLGHLVT